MIELINLKYSIEDRILYDELSYKFEDKLYVIKGRNGSGKTTLLNNIMNFKKGYSGKIKKDKTIYISQENYLFNNISVCDNINLLSDNPNKSLHLLKKLSNIDNRKKIKTLSGGEKQLVKLVIGLYCYGDNYIIDEPLNDLDKGNAQVIKLLIENLQGCVIVVDHQNKIKGQKVNLKKRKLLND